MRKKIVLLLLCVAILCPIGASLAGEKKNPGLEPYLPTKIDWAALNLQAYNYKSDWRSKALVLERSWLSNGIDTIICRIRYKANASANGLEQAKKYAKELFETYRENNKWPWLKLKIEIKPIKLPRYQSKPREFPKRNFSTDWEAGAGVGGR
jgi:hypothetical protein